MWSFFCLFTVEMKFIPICNLQTFLWAPGLERAPWVWMGWDGGGGDERKGRRRGIKPVFAKNVQSRNPISVLAESPFPRSVKIQGLEMRTKRNWGDFGASLPLRRSFQGIRDYKSRQKKAIMGIIQGAGNDSCTF